MAIKKSELYSSLWASCDALRGGMDASQYKDYVLVLLFIKYISDKYAGQPFAPITIPDGATFDDLLSLKGAVDIGDRINKEIIAPIQEANQLNDMPDFNDDAKLGSGKEMVDRLTDLIAIFEDRALDFSSNNAEGDDILGDAYEYLMRHFATESGKSKGQFYTPAEVSRILAKVIGIAEAETTSSTTAYDPTCGSGSLLLKVGSEAKVKPTLYGQEMDSATSGLAKMNMILHDYPTAEIKRGNTLANPLFKDDNGDLQSYDYVVANPPFSDKKWTTGVTVDSDPRFKHFGTPPDKQGDYAYLLHILSSMKSTAKGACILPHGVLFRGNAEASIRENLIKRGYIKGIIGLPANLFYGTGIPACIIVLDKEHAQSRKGIFMVDASSGFIKDGNKNRLRERDLHKIVDAFTTMEEVTGYARMVGLEEIEKNDYNLNLPRYIDSSVAEDIQDLSGHLQGGIPERDIEAMSHYWRAFSHLKKDLFTEVRPHYYQLSTLNSPLKSHPEFASFMAALDAIFQEWEEQQIPLLKGLSIGFNPKQLIHDLSEHLLEHYEGLKLVDHYAVYQHLMNYWAETMQDDAYLISADGWKAETTRITVKSKAGKVQDKGWSCDLIPKSLITARYFPEFLSEIKKTESAIESYLSELSELEEEHSGEDGAFSELEKINKAEVAKRLKEIKGEGSGEESILTQWMQKNNLLTKVKKALTEAEKELDLQAYEKYPTLTEDEIKVLVVEDKWLATLQTEISGEQDRISQGLTQRLKELSERYNTPLSDLTQEAATLEEKVAQHLTKMGLSW